MIEENKVCGYTEWWRDGINAKQSKRKKERRDFNVASHSH